MTLALASYILASILTLQQALDVISTRLVLSKMRGHEANVLMEKVMKALGNWWWIIKLPLVGYIWFMVATLEPSRLTVAFFLVAVLGYTWVIWNNYKVAWRHA